MSAAFDRILLDVEELFQFPPHHVAIREPFDYYMFFQNYIRNSYVGNISLFYEIEQKLQQGHNIVLISNHQTEADPAIISLLIERTHSNMAEKMIYIAGDRVVTDPLCKPFSMGRCSRYFIGESTYLLLLLKIYYFRMHSLSTRNLQCVYSKKHMEDVPELTEMKKRANTRTLKEMALLLRNGSQII